MTDNARRTGAALLPVAVLGLAALSACGFSGTGAPVRPTTSAPPPPVSPAAYQQALTALDTALAPGFSALAGAATPKAITSAADALSDVATGELSTVRRLRPPTAARTGQNELLSGLQGLVTALGSVSGAAGDNRICLGSAATALLSRDDGLVPLRTASTALATADPANPYHVGAYLPPVTPDTTRSAATGTIVAGTRTHGEGWLTITNGGDTDATVGLVRNAAATPVVSVYVGHGGSYMLKGIPDGTYTIFVAGGDDWDAGARLFARDCEFQKFDDPLVFTTTTTQATTYDITLTPVTGGTATESDVDPSTFPH